MSTGRYGVHRDQGMGPDEKPVPPYSQTDHGGPKDIEEEPRIVSKARFSTPHLLLYSYITYFAKHVTRCVVQLAVELTRYVVQFNVCDLYESGMLRIPRFDRVGMIG